MRVSSKYISVIIPTWNRTTELARAICSVYSQTFKDFEVIVIDDGSEDDQLSAIPKHLRQEIKFIKLRENRGAAFARNVGCLASSGEYLSFLDSDDEYLPNKLERQVDILYSHKGSDVTLVYCDTNTIDELGRYHSVNPIFYQGEEFFRGLLRPAWCPCTSTLLIKRSEFMRIGGFDIHLPSFQDHDLLIRLSNGTTGILAVPESLVIRHTAAQNQITRNLLARRQGFEMFDGKWRQDIKQLYGESGYSKFKTRRLMHQHLLEIQEQIDADRKMGATIRTATLLRFASFTSDTWFSFQLLGIFLREVLRIWCRKPLYNKLRTLYRKSRILNP